ncbi:3'-5' exoribonuclease YhaM family protein [Planctomycetes bacterium K23_9]|uniref:3'-5' exoribonuclease YhaM n=1 Tax=Stieleria marina TaxID=1930275 RepID=A0A517NP34_9BACT|nr:3'-5' exoribonuclease YhaM [Planctomycetes bacterium K23_9]
MNRTPIVDLNDGQSFEQAFQAADKQLRVNRQGGKYILMKLSDQSGTIAGMMWNADEKMFESFDRSDYVFCKGRTQIHNGNLQVIVTSIERMDPSEIELSEFERFDAAAADQLETRLRELLGGLRNIHLRALGETYLGDEDLLGRLKSAAAAVSNHHAYPGGLLRHTIDLMEMCQAIGPRYPQMDTELLMFGAFLHDLGKIEELSSGGEISYTDRGQMLGHIVIGIQMLDEKIRSLQTDSNDRFPDELKLHLEHLVVSHHGQLEYGSPKLPVTLEAVALHHIDNLDAKITAYTSVIESDVAADGNWTNYNPSIGRKLWKNRD